MRIAIISDTHFGDDYSQLISVQNEKPVIGKKYKDFKQAIQDKSGGRCDYLVLAGDILDFSIASYEKAYSCAKKFFQQILKDELADKVIYLAGNHDADIWHIVQHQRSIINRIAEDKLPKSYQHSVAGILDDRSDSPDECRGLTLDGVRIRENDNKKYGGMYLDNIAQGITFFFAYPNLYIATDTESVLVTHGQYLELYWSFMGEIADKVAYDDLKVGDIDIEEMTQMNFPLNQLACTGIGQAGVLTERVIRTIELDFKNNRLDRIIKYINRLEKEIDDLTDFNWLKELVADYLIGKIKDDIMAEIKNIKPTRYRDDFIHDRKVQERFRRFYNSCLLEIGSINSKPPFDCCNLPVPCKVIFGHTHQPIPYNDPNPPKFGTGVSAKRLTLHNTGGWLLEKSEFKGAEIFFYETGKGFSSVQIR